jgi:5-methylcytosine-specific restriction endonuclease McrA
MAKPAHNRNSSLWKKIRERVLRRDSYICYYCGQDADTVDHIVPIAKGGGDEMDNLVAACRSCNYSKQDKSEADFLAGKSTVHIPRDFLSPPNDSRRHE